MKGAFMKAAVGTVTGVIAMATVAVVANAQVGVDVITPNVRVQVGNPAPPPVTIVERERVIVRESDGRHDYGKHKRHDKKHKKQKKHKD